MVKTRIICTLGPESSSETILRRMMLAGMDVVRLNFSHGNYSDYLLYIDIVRKLNQKYKRCVRILQDLEGPRVRVGILKGHRPVFLKKGQILWFARNDIHEHDNVIPFDYEGPISGFKKADFIYIDDGNIVLKVKDAGKVRVKTKVVMGGLLKEHKGMNVPGVRLEFPRLSEKDKKDIEFGIKQGVDYIAQSFVRNRSDVTEVRKKTEHNAPHCKVIAKIENREGIKNIDKIIDVSDGIMIARGDMGVSIPIYEVPMVQKRIIKKCNKRKKIVITATQMLESMTDNIRPTRAEVTDVANAIIDGTDFMMLSGETAIGKYPVESVKMMNDIIKFTEKSLQF